MAKGKGILGFFKEDPDKYDFHSDNYLIREGQKIPDIYLLTPIIKRQVLLKLGSKGMLKGAALEKYNKIIQGEYHEE